MKSRTRIAVLVAAATLVVAPLPAPAQEAVRDGAERLAVEPNVVYGMVSGLALLMDVYRPHRPNGRGILVIPGSGWHAPLRYGAAPLKGARPGELGRVVSLYSALLDAGYTLFLINHRAAPRFGYPDPVHDVQRAVRFVRHRAAEYGVAPEPLGALGHSSGGHLASLLGTLEGAGDPTAPDPVDRESARVQAVVAGAAPTDLVEVDNAWPASVVAVFLGQARSPENHALYREASPVHHVSSDDAPFLLVHGDADPTVPFRNAELMHEALREAGVDAGLIPIEGGAHGAPYRTELVGRIVGWFNRRLLGPAAMRELEPLVSALDRAAAGEGLARAGDVEAAVAAYEAARRMSERLTISASSWNQLCWWGSLYGRAALVLPACERAVELAPGHPGIRDSRGVARALTGDARGAIVDFEFFVEATRADAPARATRQSWIEALRLGRDPFTPETLESLRRR